VSRAFQQADRAASSALASAASSALAALPTTLEHCLRAFTAADTLSGMNQLYCPRCKAHSDARQRLSVFSLPDVLIVHLKRFSFQGYRGVKITDAVAYPTRGLDASAMLGCPRSSFTAGDANGDATATASDDDDSSLFDLASVSLHHGSASYGHYTAVARDFLTGEWSRLDDSSASGADAADAQQSDAYLLVYERRGAARRVREALMLE
jgi:ubiquitin carboxyl-terminal hydrolase 4/11/15